MYISVNHHAENKYHPKVWATWRGNRYLKVATEDVVVREPRCNWPTRRTKTARDVTKSRTARIPHAPMGNHDQKTAEVSMLVPIAQEWVGKLPQQSA